MDEDWRNTCRLFDATPRGQSQESVALKGPKSVCTNIVMLHIKSKVMKSRIQWCKNFASWGMTGGH